MPGPPRRPATIFLAFVLALLPACGESDREPRDRDRSSKAQRSSAEDRARAGERRDPSGPQEPDRANPDRHSPSPAIPAEARPTTVTENTDGDTVVLAATGPSRLIGVDTPEVYGGTECFGPEASDYTADRLAPGTRVFYVFGAERKDQYRRSLVYIWLSGGTFFNAELVRDGYATPLAISPNTEYASEFSRYASKARSEDEGLWGKSACDRGAYDGSSQASSAGSQSGGSGASGGGNCTPGYSPCLAPADDYDCAGGSGDGPKYAQGPVRVSGGDPYELDDDSDGAAC
ncbi:hypothetical protein HJD18_12560 [Thermoleophilia bacterium SCSIO 60948]|nr:hypothetical protein HJD18_12560 [Thermoleophilia bacterium SCSIO 60948]